MNICANGNVNENDYFNCTVIACVNCRGYSKINMINHI